VPRTSPENATVIFACARELAAQVEALHGVKLDLPAEEPSRDPLESRISYTRMFAFWDVAMRAVRSPALPVHVGAKVSPRTYGAASFVCMTQTTLGAAIEQLCRFERVFGDLSCFDVVREGPASHLVYLPTFDDRLGVRAYVEALLVELVVSGRAFTGAELRPLAVAFRHARPADTRAHEAFFGCDVVWGAPSSRITLSHEALDLPLRKADPELATFFEELVTRSLGGAAPRGALERELRPLIASALHRGEPTLSDLARPIGTSERTLRRRLREAGLSFQKLLDDTRYELAKRYLEERLTVSEIAFLLGFTEPSAFHRAFKRWTGETPLDHRRRLAPATPRAGPP